jgi:hypothetical protein
MAHNRRQRLPSGRPLGKAALLATAADGQGGRRRCTYRRRHSLSKKCSSDARAKFRLAEEYDTAQERGEVSRLGSNQHQGITDENTLPTVADLGQGKRDIPDENIPAASNEKKPFQTRTAFLRRRGKDIPNENVFPLSTSYSRRE